MGNLITLDTEDIAGQVSKTLNSFPHIAGAYLFGSALGACRPDSDIDIGIVLEDVKLSDRQSEHLEAGIANALGSYNGHPYDVTLLDIDNIIFCFRVIKEGRLIFARNHDRVTDIIEYVSRRYADVYPRYRMALEEILEEVIACEDRP